MTEIENSVNAFDSARKIFPGGVNSPVRAFGGVGGTPRFIKKAKGAYLWDVDDNRYIDLVGSWGPAILGHADPVVIAAIQEASCDGLSFGAPTEGETRLAELIQGFLPCMEMMRFVSSGTEACMSAIRLARGYTGREIIIKFDGCYHGHADSLLVKAGSGALTFGQASSLGVPESIAQLSLSLPFNDCDQLRDAFAQHGHNIACVILEVIVGNSGLIRPDAIFLEAIQDLCTKHQAVLIADEVMTGFRVAAGGAQSIYGLKPDLCTLGKVVGGGLPLAVYGGKRDIMEQLSPLGGVYQAGTLSGNPVAVRSGIATLTQLQHLSYPELSATGRYLSNGLSMLAHKNGIPFNSDCEGGMLGYFFRSLPVKNSQDAEDVNHEAFRMFFGSMLNDGIYLPPSAYEASFISKAHTQKDMDEVLSAAEKAFALLRKAHG